MAYFTRQTLMASASRVRTIVESSNRARVAALARDDFDIFLSHSSLDKEAVDAADETLRGMGYSVYLDRRVDAHLDPTTVTPATVAALQKRMRQSRCLLVATSSNINQSKWAPWEMGFMDGARDRVATLPVLASASDTFSGQEYFSAYPAAQPDRTDAPTKIMVGLAGRTTQELRAWASGGRK